MKNEATFNDVACNLGFLLGNVISELKLSCNTYSFTVKQFSKKTKKQEMGAESSKTSLSWIYRLYYYSHEIMITMINNNFHLKSLYQTRVYQKV